MALAAVARGQTFVKEFHMASYARVLSLLVFLLIGIVDSANAVAIPTADGRRVYVNATAQDPPGSDFEEDESTPPSPFAPWTAAVDADAFVVATIAISTADQLSTVSPTLFTGVGSAAVTLSVPDSAETADASAVGAGESLFFIAFDLLTPHSFLLTGTLSESRPGVTFLDVGPFSFSGNTAIVLAETLDPGSYSFRAVSTASPFVVIGPGVDSVSGAFNFEFALTEIPSQVPVPEPTGSILLTIGLAVTGVFRRLRR